MRCAASALLDVLERGEYLGAPFRHRDFEVFLNLRALGLRFGGQTIALGLCGFDDTSSLGTRLGHRLLVFGRQRGAPLFQLCDE